jgi:hypothetical protein
MKKFNWIKTLGPKTKITFFAVLLNLFVISPASAQEYCDIYQDSGSCSSHSLSGVVTVTADSGWDIKIDGNNVGRTSYNWDTATAWSGSHTIGECSDQPHTTTNCTSTYYPKWVYVPHQTCDPNYDWVDNYVYEPDTQCDEFDADGNCLSSSDHGGSYVNEPIWEQVGETCYDDGGNVDQGGSYVNTCEDVTNYSYDCSSPITVYVADRVATSDTCSIVGGQGAQLFNPTTLTQLECQSQCSNTYQVHPNEVCLWGALDIAPQGFCHIVGGQGGKLSDGTMTRGQCVITGQNLFPIHPNLSIMWNGGDVTPTGECLIVGADGKKLFDQVDTHYQCHAACGDQQPKSPVCRWGFKTDNLLAYP